MKAKVRYARPRVLINAPRMLESYKNRCRIEAIKEGIKRYSIPDKVYIDNVNEAAEPDRAEREDLEQSFDEALDTIDDMVDTVAEEIIATAHQNDDFICTSCLRTAQRLFGLFRKYAREEDAIKLREDWKSITGRDIYD